MKRFAAALLSLSFALPAEADLSDMTASERENFRNEVRAYLLENPEVLMEAITVLEQRQATAETVADTDMIAQHAEALFEDGHSWIAGNPDGDLTLVEFADYRCGYCRRAHDEVKELIESDGNIRFVYKEFPILGEASLASSRFALATREVAGDEAYGAAQEALLGLNAEPSDAVLTRLANQLNLDGEAILAEMSSPKVNEIIRANHDLARALNINGTPTFVLGGEMLRGYVPLEQMREIVDEVREDS
ncbi:Protein-disulfide isomerase [Poseidonocella pacifica]|uniref:Protein-disulfide isomerase n=1 Tax=Poseidonocella pacifica TaxID=871651 RepID=A0A1I0V707_9RHOB|nr:DsbA family protein [Poseidonocella pacifica]SFA72022.1 Protein-disulfide isomerase [Poseidonocella pacifica]